MGNRIYLPVSIPQTVQSACHVTLQARTKPEVGDWDMSFSLFWHWWKKAFTCGSCKGNRSVYWWWCTDSELGRQALLSTIPQEMRLRAFFPLTTERSTEDPQVTTALWMLMPAHFKLSSLIPLALTGEWHPLAACLPSFLSSLPPYLPPYLSLFSPSIFLFIPPLYSRFSMFLISSVQIPEIFRNLSFIVYDTPGTMLSLTCLVTFPGLMCLYQPGIRTQQKPRHAYIPRHLGFELLESAWNFSKFWVELCFK